MLYETNGHAVFIDPLADDGDEPFWAWADQRCAERAAVVVLTLRFHQRSRERFLARFGACDALPAAVEALAFPALDETMYWLREHRALVPGDRLLGDGDGGLALCPQSWLRYLARPPTRAQLRQQLAALLELDVSIVLPSHGEPVLAGGDAALARALAAA